MDKQKILKLNEIVQKSQNLVFFGGAGVSTESGIPDFRSTDGLYSQTYQYPPEVMLSHSFFRQHPKEFYAFYHDKMLPLTAAPNPAHTKLASWEREGRLKAVITQNIDGLHQKAGSKNVVELHGSIHRNHCLTCHHSYSAQHMQSTSGVPRCQCGGIIKPDVVLYEESLRTEDMEAALSAIKAADTLIIGGTSLVVYPAAGLVQHFRGKHLVVINKGEIQANASLVITDPIGEVFAQLN